jgi:hypothetical protein
MPDVESRMIGVRDSLHRYTGLTIHDSTKRTHFLLVNLRGSD